MLSYTVIEEVALNEEGYIILLKNQDKTNNAYDDFRDGIINREEIIVDELKSYLHLEDGFEIELDKKDIDSYFILKGTDCENISYVNLTIKSNGKDISHNEKLMVYIKNGRVELDVI